MPSEVKEMQLKQEMSREAKKGLTRRIFLGWGAAVFMGITALATFFFALVRMLFPPVRPGKSGRFKIGTREEFPPGTTKYFEDQHVYVFSDQEGIHAMSAVCTHLACIAVKEADGFVCPCHGSRYGIDGRLEKGPAPKPLPWYGISRLSNGQLVVDKKRKIKPGVQFN
jgi:cytochrome b6-f complex iron-sulfur subunit